MSPLSTHDHMAPEKADVDVISKSSCVSAQQVENGCSHLRHALFDSTTEDRYSKCLSTPILRARLSTTWMVRWNDAGVT